MSNLVLHLHPSNVPEEAIRFSLTFGLGGMAALLLALRVFTGILLRFQYIPTVDAAYMSIIAIQEQFIFGQLVRNIHYWSGQFLKSIWKYLGVLAILEALVISFSMMRTRTSAGAHRSKLYKSAGKLADLAPGTIVHVMHRHSISWAM